MKKEDVELFIKVKAKSLAYIKRLVYCLKRTLMM